MLDLPDGGSGAHPCAPADVASVLDLAEAHTLDCCQAQTQTEGMPFGIGNFHRPVVSESAAVHPDQIPEAMALLKKKGVPTEYDHHGRPILTSKEHKRRFAKALGHTRRDEFY